MKVEIGPLQTKVEFKYLENVKEGRSQRSAPICSSISANTVYGAAKGGAFWRPWVAFWAFHLPPQ